MEKSQEPSTAINQNFEIIKNERQAKNIAKLALAKDFELRQQWLSQNFPATFGRKRDSPTYFGYEGLSLLDAINMDSATPYLKLWAAETMVRALTHLSNSEYRPVSGEEAFDEMGYRKDFGMRTEDQPSAKQSSGQLTYVDSSVGPDWLRPLKKKHDVSPNERDFYGVINQLPDSLRNEGTRAYIASRSERRNHIRGWPVDFSANGLGGAIVEMEDLVLQVSVINSNAPRNFKTPGVYQEGDKYPALDNMQDPHIIRAWRTQEDV